MSIKLSVGYGKDPKPLTELAQGDMHVTFFAREEDGETIAVRSFNATDLDVIQEHRVLLYGLNKLLTDRTSDEKDKVVKLGKMQAVFDMLVSGEWTKERTVGAIVVSPEVEALAQMQSMSVPDAQAALAQYDKDVRKQILGREDVQAKAQEIREARKDAAVKTLDDLLPAAE